MAKTKRSPITVRRNERAAHVHKFRADGWTLDQIADEVGVHRATVIRDLDEHEALLIERTQDLQAEIRATEDARLLAVIDAGWNMVDRLVDRHAQIVTKDGDMVDGDPIDYKAAQALGQILRASTERRKLFGVDPPVKVSATFEPELSREQAASILAELDATR